MPTIFERIDSGEIPSAKVYEDEHVIAFMDAGQVNPGHVIVATKKPFETITDADPGEWQQPSFLAQLVPASVKVTIADGQKVRQDLRIAR